MVLLEGFYSASRHQGQAFTS